MFDDRLFKKLMFGQLGQFKFTNLQMLGTGVKGRHSMDSWNKIVCNDLLKLRAAYSWYTTVFDGTA